MRPLRSEPFASRRLEGYADGRFAALSANCQPTVSDGA